MVQVANTTITMCMGENLNANFNHSGCGCFDKQNLGTADSLSHASVRHLYMTVLDNATWRVRDCMHGS